MFWVGLHSKLYIKIRNADVPWYNDARQTFINGQFGNFVMGTVHDISAFFANANLAPIKPASVQVLNMCDIRFCPVLIIDRRKGFSTVIREVVQKQLFLGCHSRDRCECHPAGFVHNKSLIL